MFLNWTGVVKQCLEFVARSSELLHSMNLVLTKVREQLMRAQLELGEWEGALDTGIFISKAYRYD